MGRVGSTRPFKYPADHHCFTLVALARAILPVITITTYFFKESSIINARVLLLMNKSYCKCIAKVIELSNKIKD